MSFADFVLSFLFKGKKKKEVRNIALDNIHPNPFQPRRKFNESSLRELANSISEYGVIQPVLLRQAKHEEGYELVSGERRVRASKLVGQLTVPAIIGEFSDLELIEIAFIENLQRENLDVLEEAKGYDIIKDEFKSLSIEDIAKKLGKSTEEISEKLSFLSLPVILQEALAMGMITKVDAEKLRSLETTDVHIQHLKENFQKEFALKEIRRILRERMELGIEDISFERKLFLLKDFILKLGKILGELGLDVSEDENGIRIYLGDSRKHRGEQ